MLTALAKDLTGAADICAVVESSEALAKLAVRPYVLSHEQLLFALASPKEEFAFTDEALVVVRGDSAVNPRKRVERFEFHADDVSDVQFETPGRLDRDCELRFRIGDQLVSIGIKRKHEPRAKRVYLALLALAKEQETRQRDWSHSQMTLESVVTQRKPDANRRCAEDSQRSETVVDKASAVLASLTTNFERYRQSSYKDVIMTAFASE